jgi:hypothetical protein
MGRGVQYDCLGESSSLECTPLIADDEQGSSQIVAGRCCDIYGRKRMYHYGMILLILSNTLSTFMPVSLP